MASKLARGAMGAALFFGMMVSSVAPAMAQYWQCAPYAREISGIQLFGNASGWWDQADGKYARGNVPMVGSVLAMKSHGKMRAGHVAMVSEVISDREVLLTHANWSHGGKIERNVRAMDVSAAGDWSKVRVWYAPMGDLGLTSYPAYGFIYGEKAEPGRANADLKFADNRAGNRLAEIAGVIEGLRSN